MVGDSPTFLNEKKAGENMTINKQSHGYDNIIVVGKEDTFATPATSYNWIGIIEDFEPEENNNTDVRQSVGQRNPFMLRPAGHEVDGKMTFKIQNGRIFQLALGDVTTTGDGSSGYTHTITPIKSGESLPSTSVQVHNVLHNYVETYYGGKVNTLKLTMKSEDPIEAETEFNFVGVDTQQGASTVTPDTSTYFMFYDAQVKINGVMNPDVSECDIEINNNLERKFTLNNSRYPERIEEGSLELSGSITIDYTSTQPIVDFRNGNQIDLTIVLARYDEATHTIDTNETITINLLDGVYDTQKVAVNAQDSQEIELDCLFKDISVEIKTAQATLF